LTQSFDTANFRYFPACPAGIWRVQRKCVLFGFNPVLFGLGRDEMTTTLVSQFNGGFEMTKQLKRAASNYIRACRHGVGYLINTGRPLPDWAGPRIIAFKANTGDLRSLFSIHDLNRLGKLAFDNGPLKTNWTGK
jgi:hypothetical protein